MYNESNFLYFFQAYVFVTKMPDDLQFLAYPLDQRCPNYGPRAKPGPTDNFIRPANVFDFSNRKLKKKNEKIINNKKRLFKLIKNNKNGGNIS